ncbi:hypothetical protein MTO96_009894 [Rhipicephalus appendiculatus]
MPLITPNNGSAVSRQAKKGGEGGGKRRKGCRLEKEGLELRPRAAHNTKRGARTHWAPADGLHPTATAPRAGRRRYWNPAAATLGQRLVSKGASRRPGSGPALITLLARARARGRTLAKQCTRKRAKTRPDTSSACRLSKLAARCICMQMKSQRTNGAEA